MTGALALYRPPAGGVGGPGVSHLEPPSGWQRVRAVANLLNLSTLAGLTVARLGGCALRPGPGGLVLAEGYRLGFPVAGAFTIGDVVLTPGSFAELLRRLPRVLEHEERHSWQYACCLGLPFWVAYTAAMGWSVLRTGDRAARNVFERHAGLATGGYADLPTIPVRVQLRRASTRVKPILGAERRPAAPSARSKQP